MPNNNKRTNDHEAKKEKNRIRMRLKRLEVKSNPETYNAERLKESERWKKRVAEGKIKKVSEASERQKRQLRKKWKETKKEQRAKKSTLEAAVPGTSGSSEPEPSSPHMENLQRGNGSHQKDSGKKRARKRREEQQKALSKLQKQNKQLAARLNKYRVEVHRLKKNTNSDNPIQIEELTPKRRTEAVLMLSPKQVKRRLLFGEVMRDQIKVYKHTGNKKSIAQMIGGSVVSKYGFRRTLSRLSSRCSAYNTYRLRRVQKTKMAKEIEHFFLQDEVSRMCPGKKDTFTKNKVKHQRRYLRDTLVRLYKKFQQTHRNTVVSFATFARHRPFYVVKPPTKRDTCLCQVCENVALLVGRLKTSGMVQSGHPSSLMQELCCNRETVNDDCLTRACKDCKINKISFQLGPNEQNDDFWYEKWEQVSVPVTIKGQLKVNIAATYGDIKSVSDLIEQVKNVCKVKIIAVTLDEIEAVDIIMPNNLTPFNGTMKVHWVFWNKRKPDELRLHALTCISCSDANICNHHLLGAIQTQVKPGKLRVSDVYTSDEESSCEMPHSNQDQVPISVGDYVVVEYDGDLFPGLVERQDDKMYLVSCMEKSKKTNTYKWPKKSDTLLYSRDKIKKKLASPPVMVNKRGFFKFGDWQA